MTWEQAANQWEERKLDAKEQWSELTDNDLEFIAGHRDRLVRALRRHYGLLPQQAQKRIDWWLQNLHEERSHQDRPYAHVG